MFQKFDFRKKDIVYPNSNVKMVKNRSQNSHFPYENSHFGPNFSPTSRRNLGILYIQIFKLMIKALKFILIVNQNSYGKLVKNRGQNDHFSL